MTYNVSSLQLKIDMRRAHTTVKNRQSKMFKGLAFGWPFILAVWSVSTVGAAIFIKADNTVNLNLAAIWTNNAVPGSADIAGFDGTFSAPNNTANIGANLHGGSFKKIKS